MNSSKYKSMEDFQKDLEVKSDQVTRNLESFMKGNFDAPDIIIDSIKYSLFADGKRIRPVLTLEVAKALGKDSQFVEPLAEAIELIHTYSLIHDDLPAMDNAEMRRGKETNHRVFGEDTAILAGDSLLNLAMERALQGAPYVPYTEAKNYLLAMRLLFNNSGVNGLIGGQVADTCTQTKNTEHDDYDYISSHKTGALISAAVLCGCIPFYGMYDPQVQALFKYSKKIGRIFQIVDDILDVTSTQEELGKDVKQDENNNTNSYMTTHNLDEAQEEIEKLRDEAYECLSSLDGDTDFLYFLTDYLCSRGK